MVNSKMGAKAIILNLICQKHVFILIILIIFQVKVWFQNRRTKHKKDSSVQSTVTDDVNICDVTTGAFNGTSRPPMTTNRHVFDVLPPPHTLMMSSLLPPRSLNASATTAAAVSMTTVRPFPTSYSNMFYSPIHFHN